MDKHMKFRVESSAHSIDIQRALFRIGAKWAGHPTEVQHQFEKTEYPYLFVNMEGDVRIIRYANEKSEAFFNEDKGVEYVYRLGMVEPRNGRPVQTVPPPILDMNDPTDMHAHAPDPKPYTVRVETIGGNVSYLDMRPQPPIGIKPRREADKMHAISRGLELGAAINRYTNAQLVVPMEWLTEYNERVEEIRKLEKIA